MSFDLNEMLKQAKDALENVSEDEEKSSNIGSFFKEGGVFYFDEEDSASENSFYKVEELMGTDEGMNICATDVDEEGTISIYHDSEAISSEDAIEKYNNGDYKKII